MDRKVKALCSAAAGTSVRHSRACALAAAARAAAASRAGAGLPHTCHAPDSTILLIYDLNSGDGKLLGTLSGWKNTHYSILNCKYVTAEFRRW